MSRYNDMVPGPVPDRWLHCPRKSSKLIVNKFLAFKTPLSSRFDSQVPEQCRFTPTMLFEATKSYKVNTSKLMWPIETIEIYMQTSSENELLF
jgi:mRNA-capping enzyme